MGTINQVKQMAEADTPLLFFRCVMPSGDVQRWCSHAIAFKEQQYEARVLKHNLFDLQLSADDAVDGISQLSLTLANVDSKLSELNHEIGFKGSRLIVYFAFADLPSGAITTEETVLFRGVAGDPDEISESTLRLTFNNKLSLQRVAIPDVRVQRTCSWSFPGSPDQRMEAKDGGAKGRYSRFYRCGYSADVPGGVGNLANGQAFTSCDKSRAQCQERGMFDADISGNVTRRFGGLEFIPSAINVRTSGAKTSHLSPLLENSALYNDPIPIVYGTGWLKAPVIFARNDGNLTHMEVLLGMGTLQSPPKGPTVLKTVVNDVEIPEGVAGQDMTTTGWYSVITAGDREGSFNPDFRDSNGQLLGDPHGSMAVLSVIVPNRISSGRSLPTVEVLLQGIGLDTYDESGTLTSAGSPVHTSNPAWVMLDILRRCGWTLDELDLPSFAASAVYCAELITTTDLNRNSVTIPRVQCNLILNTRQSAASVMRGVRAAASLMLRYGANGLLELLPESTLARQQRALPDGSNSLTSLNGGWPAYEFSDGTGSFSGIARSANGGSSVRITSRSVAETSNRLSIEFQDEANEYQQDSLSLVNADDSALIGYEISSQSTALGIANLNQATRVLLRQLDKSTKGNQFIQFQTSFRALKVRPGDIITITYAKEWLSRVPFRVVKLSPSLNYQTVTILAQIHDDDWYSDSSAVLAAAGRQPGSHVQTPRPLIGSTFDEFGSNQFEISEDIQVLADGTALDTLTVNFSQPTMPAKNLASLPLVSLSSQCSTEAGGTLAGGTSYYYAVTAVEAGKEGSLSFTIPVSVSQDCNTATINIFSFPRSADSFNVYRGSTPQLLYRIANGLPVEGNSGASGIFFKDTGYLPQAFGPPDSNFDHANFYYRRRYAGPFRATIVGTAEIGNDDMNAVPSVYSNNARVVRIVSGTGLGQERSIVANDSKSFTVNPAWSVLPDQTSKFAVVDSSWKFAAVSVTSPVQFQVPYQAGASIEISGRAANVNNQEGTADLCPMTVLNPGGAKPDAGTPTAPMFSLFAPGGGVLKASQIGFNDYANTQSITGGTLQIFYWDEIARRTLNLKSDMNADDNTISIAGTVNLQSGDVVQVGLDLDAELMTILQRKDFSTDTYHVDRQTFKNVPKDHKSGDTALLLQSSRLVLPFERGFFQNQASSNYLHTVNLPDCRVLGAEMQMTNSFGDGQTRSVSYLSAPLRTCSGGQFSLQVGGYLATQTNTAPPLLVQETHAVRDVWLSLGEASQGYIINIDIFQTDSLGNATKYLHFQVPAQSASAYKCIDGASLPALQKETTLTMDVSLSAPAASANYAGPFSPGRDLTVTIRF